MLAAGEEGKWKEFLPSMGTEAHIPKLFKSSSKARAAHSKGVTRGLLLRSEMTYRVSYQGAFYMFSPLVQSMWSTGNVHAYASQGPIGECCRT